VHLIVEQVDAFWKRGEHGKLRRWVEVLPDELLISEPRLGSIRAYYLHTIGQYEKGERLLQKIEKVLAAQSDPGIDDPLLKRIQLSEAERQKLQGRISVFRALISSFGGDVREMIQHADRALEVLPEGDITWRNLAAFALGDAHSYLGDMAESYNARSEAFRDCKAAGNVYYTIIAGLKLALTLKEQGKLREALELCEDQIKQASEYSLTETTFAGCTKALWGEVLAELNDLEAAKHHAVQGVEISERGSNLVTLAMGYLSLMEVLFSSGDLESAENIIQKVSKLDREITVPPWLLSQMAAWQARIWLERDTLEVISDWESELGLFFNNENIALEDIDYFKLIEYIVYARVLIARGRLDEANRLLKQLDTAAEMGGRIGRLIEIKILQALAFQSVGDTNQALEWLKQAFTHAEAGGFLRIFVDEGQEMGRLLYQALDNGIAPNYVQRLLAAFSSEETEIDTPTVPQVSDASYIEPLSEREIEVLQLIAEGLTNPEIASRLYLSMHTIKTHTRNIYGKLDVHNRTEAVGRARALGVLSIT
jgi:LuxR family maltose regulon positive regulatory protein